jgi:phosphatidylglycerol:prolipoprotein diacylglycerol transferase
MKPALFLHPHISSYPLMMVLGFFFGWVLARKRATSFGLRKSDLDNICLLLPFAGLFGARFFARLFYAKVGVLESLKVWEGDGLVFYGGVLFGFMMVTGYGLCKRIKLISLWDCMAPSLALGLALGRIGCFLGGCCWGDVCVSPDRLASLQDQTVMQRIYTIPAISSANWALAVSFPQESDIFKQHLKLGLISDNEAQSLPVHPVQLYEAFLALLLSAFIHLRFRRPTAPGNAAIAFLLGYAAIRFFTEFLRADNKTYALQMTFSQVVSIEIILLCGFLLSVRSLKTLLRTRKKEVIPQREETAEVH